MINNQEGKKRSQSGSVVELERGVSDRDTRDTKHPHNRQPPKKVSAETGHHFCRNPVRTTHTLLSCRWGLRA